MTKPNSGQLAGGQLATRTDLDQILGEIDDETAVAILSLNPSVVQIEEAGIWLEGTDDFLRRGDHPIDPIVSQILDLVATEDEEPPGPRV